VSTIGTVDSVAIPEIVQGGYRKDFRAAMMRYQFKPAMDQGRAIPGTYSLTFTF
jgi:hypothetical protein